ncbi:MAG: hypothetical protein OXB98_17035 [Bryobacterales bacterium]|nr:hypothetical protein [Bryobacterales bacterium]
MEPVRDNYVKEIASTAVDRRTFLQTTLAGTGLVASRCSDTAMKTLRLCPFRFDVTPPLGHSLCGGWIQPVVGVDDPLEAIGFVLLGLDKPIVICVVDWTGILNAAHIAWRQALAEAAGTTPERVALHSVHPHNAPFACLDAQQIVAQYPELPPTLDLAFFQSCLERTRDAVSKALTQPRQVTAVAHGQARVGKVASNRRIVGADGKVGSQRGSSSRNPEHHRLPEGVIDPWLKTVAFYDNGKKVAACHYYACHPMSYYGDGRVSADFCGLARRQRQREEPECLHLYFNGCGGNVGAGKYNDGSKPMRRVLTERMYQAITLSEANLRPEPIESVDWRTVPFLPEPHPRFDAGELAARIADPSRSVVERNRPSYTLAYLRRFARGDPIVVSGLQVNDVSMLHLPGECFVEYQLRAQEMRPERFVATAAYGDDGPWYIPTKESYPQGGYEVSVAWCDPKVDELLTTAVRKLLIS